MADAHHAFAAVGEGAILQRRACKLGFLCRSESGGLKRISLAQEQERTPGYAIGDPSVTGSRPPSPSLGATQCHGHTFPRFSVESPTESRMHPLQKSACPPAASRESAGPCLHAASCSSRSPTSVCRREAASLQALLAVQHVSEPCALSLLQPCGGQQPSATSQLACSLAQRVRRSLSCAFVQLLLSLSHPRPASALRCGGNPPLRLVTFALWAPSFSLHVAVARAYRTYVRLWQVANRSRLLPRCGCG